MATGYESTVVNGQLIPVAPRQAFNPLTFGQAYTGPAYWPRNGVYNVPPVIPSAAIQGSAAPQEYGSTAMNPAPTATDANGSPFSFTKSPLIMALLMLTLGLAGLHFIHYR